MKRVLVANTLGVILAGCGLGHKSESQTEIGVAVDSSGVERTVRLKPAANAAEFAAPAKDASRDLVARHWNQYGARRGASPPIFVTIQGGATGGGTGGGSFAATAVPAAGTTVGCQL